jgi:hypothetical protein
MKQLTGILLIAIWLVIGAGCTGMNQAFHPTPPVTYAEVIRLTQEKVMPEVIIKKIADSNTVFRLNSDEVAELRRQGVDSKVVDYMMNTYIEQVRQDQAMEDWNRWWYYDGHYYWWPYWDEYYYIPMYRHHGPRH